MNVMIKKNKMVRVKNSFGERNDKKRKEMKERD